MASIQIHELNEHVGDISSEDFLATDNGTNTTKIRATALVPLDLIRPVGSAYPTVDPQFNPNITWGGNWVKLPEGYVLLSGSNSGNYQVGEDTSTGSGFMEYGENSHTLTTEEIPAHNHGQKSLTGMVACQSYSNGAPTGIVSTNYKNFNMKATFGASDFGTHNQNINATHTHETVGDGQAHSLMQKSIAVYWWIRTA